MKTGFTLSEVLITLGIIGVVAALTMPNVVTHYQKKVTANKLKKTYSILNQALQKSLIDNGGDLPLLSIPNDTGYGSGDPGAEYIIPHLQIIKKFSRRSTVYNKKRYMIYKANGEGESQFTGTGLDTSPYNYILKDGTIITYLNFLNYSPMGNALYILVDLNGFNGPNRIGRDVFIFTLTRAKPNIITTPGNNSTVDELIANKNSCPKKGEISGYQGYVGTGCSTIIMKDGWEIKEHYPWW